MKNSCNFSETGSIWQACPLPPLRASGPQPRPCRPGQRPEHLLGTGENLLISLSVPPWHWALCFSFGGAGAVTFSVKSKYFQLGPPHLYCSTSTLHLCESSHRQRVNEWALAVYQLNFVYKSTWWAGFGQAWGRGVGKRAGSRVPLLGHPTQALALFISVP